MALIHYDYKSQSIERNVPVTIILPTDELSFYDPAESAARGQNPMGQKKRYMYKPGMKFQTVYLCHGGGKNYSVTARYAALERFAQENRVMVVCPDFQFFGTDCAGGKYFTYLTEELPTIIQTVFPSSPKREDNFVMGYAMGANVALGMAVLRPDLYSACLDISGGIGMTLDTQTLVEEMKSEHFRTFMPSYKVAFGEPEDFPGSTYDLYAAAVRNKKEKKDLPLFILACGSKEFIRKRVEGDVAKLQELEYPVQYILAEGFDHDWKMWDKYLCEGLSTLLPLKHDYLYPNP